MIDDSNEFNGNNIMLVDDDPEKDK